MAVLFCVAAQCLLCESRCPEGATRKCDVCKLSFHITCLPKPVRTAPLAEGEFHCPSCSNAPMNFWTCWVPLADLGESDSRLAVAPGTHRLQGYDVPAVAKMLPGEYTKNVTGGSLACLCVRTCVCVSACCERT